ncbi:hypothetical protein GYA25_03060 [Candidatus Woesearchaeota archaeon]|nr:hypothetical protein [Candidatus Woesearchaeota archaeon]
MKEENFKVNITLLKKISKESGIKKFFLGGSVTYLNVAKNLGIDFKCNDYDLAIIGGEKKFLQIKRILSKHKFRIIKARPYFLKFKKVFQIIAEKKDITLDIAILKNLNYLGHFNWESIFWEFPSGKLYDPYESIKSIKKRELKLIILPEEENPLILASRFSKLCARFNLDISNNKELFQLTQKLSILISNWKSEDSFQGEYAREHSYFGILESILRAKDKYFFIRMLNSSGLFASFFPELSKNIKNKNLKLKKINSVKNMNELINFFKNFLLNKKDLREFNKKIKVISRRIRKN